MMLCGGLRSGLSTPPIVEMSLPVTRIALFPCSVWSERDNMFPVSEFGGKPCGLAYSCDIFIRVFWSTSAARYLLYHKGVRSGD